MAWQVNQVRGDTRTRVEVPSRHAATAKEAATVAYNTL
jgi:hypothetical protein